MNVAHTLSIPDDNTLTPMLLSDAAHHMSSLTHLVVRVSRLYISISRSLYQRHFHFFLRKNGKSFSPRALEVFKNASLRFTLLHLDNFWA